MDRVSTQLIDEGRIGFGEDPDSILKPLERAIAKSKKTGELNRSDREKIDRDVLKARQPLAKMSDREAFLVYRASLSILRELSPVIQSFLAFADTDEKRTGRNGHGSDKPETDPVEDREEKREKRKRQEGGKADRDGGESREYEERKTFDTKERSKGTGGGEEETNERNGPKWRKREIEIVEEDVRVDRERTDSIDDKRRGKREE